VFAIAGVYRLVTHAWGQAARETSRDLPQTSLPVPHNPNDTTQPNGVAK
jgi:hypothetical protein